LNDDLKDYVKNNVKNYLSNQLKKLNIKMTGDEYLNLKTFANIQLKSMKNDIKIMLEKCFNTSIFI